MTRLMVDEKLAPDFGSFLIEKLSSLYNEFSTHTGRKATS
jgi:hypothetical protein